MNLQFKLSITAPYKSNSQKIRVLSEDWVASNLYCPNCQNPSLNEFRNNQPVADFYCTKCSEEFELKSKTGKLGKRIVDGAYSSMIDRLVSLNNPNFFLLTYNNSTFTVENFILIPKHFFTPEIIEKRNPLSNTSKRAGWIGCNINISNIPELGRIFIVQNSKIQNKNEVNLKWKRSLFLRQNLNDSRGWLIDLLNCLDRIKMNEFSLSEVYKFENELRNKYPNNFFIKEKIRQQLQVLREFGVIKFLGGGKYKKLNPRN